MPAKLLKHSLILTYNNYPFSFLGLALQSNSGEVRASSTLISDYLLLCLSLTLLLSGDGESESDLRASTQV